MKGIVLAGGSGTRLHPLTLGVCKQLLPVYNKPMIYYPLSILMLAGIRDILIITTPEDQSSFQRLLGDGTSLGVNFSYVVQQAPRGLAEAFILGRKFVGTDSVALILGDNIFYGNDLESFLKRAAQKKSGATLFGYLVKDPERYGIVELDSSGRALSIEEKPAFPKSNVAVTGLYFYDNQVLEIARSLTPSARGELEITDISNAYLKMGQVSVELMGRGFAWLDAGTFDSLMQSSHFVQVIEERQGHCIASLEEIAFQKGFISIDQFYKLAKKLEKSAYGRYLMEIAAAKGVYA